MSPFSPDPPGYRAPDRSRLFELASEQGGYFTTAQAGQCGMSGPLLSHHSRPGGRFIRVRRGLYRIREYPPSAREDVIAAWLTAGRDAAVVSHDSALDLLDLSDVVPDAVHLTVPRSMRYRRRAAGTRLHTTVRPLHAGEVTVRDGVRVTSAERSIVDAAQAGTAADQIAAAVSQAVRRGMTNGRRLRKAARGRGRRVERLVQEALRQQSAA
jgi:predicted transcriptional regulator of viral defense system